jgi:hypothetical protein
MASANTHTSYLPDPRAKFAPHHLLGVIAGAAARLAKMIADADETRYGLRRRRYAALLR